MKVQQDFEVNGLAVTVTMEIDVESQAVQTGGSTTLSDDAMQRIGLVLARETRRIGEIAFVDLRDQEVNAKEAMRLRSLRGTERPMIVLAAGNKDPETAQVIRGSFEVGGKKMAAPKKGAR